MQCDLTFPKDNWPQYSLALKGVHRSLSLSTSVMNPLSKPAAPHRQSLEQSLVEFKHYQGLSFAQLPPLAISQAQSNLRHGREPRRPSLKRTVFTSAPPRRLRPALKCTGPFSCAAWSPSATSSPDSGEEFDTAQDSYLQCVECSAVYLVEPEELEGAPRVVGCSSCLHEWYASESDLLWGEEEALAALNEPTPQEARSRRAQEANTRKAMAAAHGVDRRRRVEEKEVDGGGQIDDGEVEEVEEEEELEEDEVIEAELSDDDDDLEDEVGNTGEDINGDRLEVTQGNALTERKGIEAEVEEHSVDLRSNTGRDSNGGETKVEEVKQGEVEYRDEKDEDVREKSENINVFVGNLSFRATEEDLYRAFSGYGAVLKCQIPADPSGASRGYGFVEMRSRESGLRAIECLQGTSILGRDISLNEARPRRELPGPYRRSSRSQWSSRNGRKSRGFAHENGNERGSFTVRKERKRREGYPDRWRTRS